MQRILIIVFPCCLAGVIPGQSQQPEQTKKIQWGILYGPSVNYRTLNYSNDQQFIAEMRNRMELPKLGYNAGIIARRNYRKNSAVEAMISFSNTGYKTRKIPLSWEPADYALPVDTEFNYSFLNLCLNARFRYILFGYKTKFYVLPGLGVDALIEKKTNIKIKYANDTKKKYASGVRSSHSGIGLSATTSIGVMHEFSGGFTFCLEPTIKQGLLSVNLGSSNREFLYSFGINAVMIYTR
ncbi:MAG TPA: outer membrane beta-barrel protein [Chitinophagaceae bacterium]|nr:outer membrane beta-barrel protein [Chitinophagaceae bacterium]